MPPRDDQQTSAEPAPASAPPAATLAPRAPDIVGEGERQLDPRSIGADRLSGGILAAVLSGATFVGVVIAAILTPWPLLGRALLLAGWFAACAALTLLLLWWPAVSYRHTAYEVLGEGIRIRRGVLWRSVSFVPKSRVQHTDVSQGPIERSFGLATLVIYTAGTHHASISLSGLSRETAFAIRDHLITGGPDDAV